MESSGAPNDELEQEVAALYLEHGPRLLRYAETLARNRDTGRDAVQEVFLRYFAKRRNASCVENPHDALEEFQFLQWRRRGVTLEDYSQSQALCLFFSVRPARERCYSPGH